METRHLEEFVVFARMLNYSKAASELFLSAPALRSHIESLEGSIGVPLTCRDSRGIALTEAGNILVEKSTGFLETTRQLIDACASAHKELIPLSVGTAGFSFFEQLIRESSALYTERHPAKKVLLKIRRDLTCYPEVLEEKKLDITVVPHGIEGAERAGQIVFPETVASHLLYESKVLLLVSKSNPLFAKNSLSLADIHGKTFLYSHDIYDVAKRGERKKMLAAKGCLIDITWRPFNDYHEYFMYDFQDYIGVVPEELVSRHGLTERADCKLFTLSDYDWRVALFLVWIKDAPSADVLAFIDLITELAQGGAGEGR